MQPTAGRDLFAAQVSPRLPVVIMRPLTKRFYCSSAIKTLSTSGHASAELQQQLSLIQQQMHSNNERHQQRENGHAKEKQELLSVLSELRTNAECENQRAAKQIDQLETTIESLTAQLQVLQLEHSAEEMNSKTGTGTDSSVDRTELEAARKQYKALVAKFRSSISQLQESFASVVSEKDEKVEFLNFEKLADMLKNGAEVYETR